MSQDQKFFQLYTFTRMNWAFYKIEMPVLGHEIKFLKIKTLDLIIQDQITQDRITQDRISQDQNTRSNHKNKINVFRISIWTIWSNDNLVKWLRLFCILIILPQYDLVFWSHDIWSCKTRAREIRSPNYGKSLTVCCQVQWQQPSLMRAMWPLTIIKSRLMLKHEMMINYKTAV